jgi:predicted MPP superfamily phosphohydrolase
MRKILVVLPESIAELLNKELVNISETFSDTLRTIIMSWLSEKRILDERWKT